MGIGLIIIFQMTLVGIFILKVGQMLSGTLDQMKLWVPILNVTELMDGQKTPMRLMMIGQIYIGS